MSDRYDVIVIGAGLGGLTAAALTAQAGRKTLLIERNYGVGGAASTYKSGDLVIEASLHETSQSARSRTSPSTLYWRRLGVLDKVAWVPTGSVYEVRGGPVESGVRPARRLRRRAGGADRSLSAQRAGIDHVLREMERISRGPRHIEPGPRRLRPAARRPVRASGSSGPCLRAGGYRSPSGYSARSATTKAVKCAVAANMLYWHDDPNTLWWVLFAVAQGGYLGCGGTYMQGRLAAPEQCTCQSTESSRRRAAACAARCAASCSTARAVPPASCTRQRRRRARRGARSRHHRQRCAGAHRQDAANPARDRFSAPLRRRPAVDLTLFGDVRTVSASRRARVRLLFDVPAARVDAHARRLPPVCRHSRGPAGRGDAADRRRELFRRSTAASAALPIPCRSSASTAKQLGRAGPRSLRRKALALARALTAAIDRAFPGFAAHVVACTFSTASTMSSYLNAPQGAVYGFAPLPPRGPIWKGSERSSRTAIPGLYLASVLCRERRLYGRRSGGGTAAREALRVAAVRKK